MFALLPAIAYAQAETFKDVPTTHSAFEAITYLREKGVLQGYADNTFRPDQTVNRAEAVKILVAPLISQEDLSRYTASSYSDIEDGAWFKPYVEAARQKFGIIDGPPKTSTFNGSKAVIKAEFLKMLTLSQGSDPQSAYSEFRFPLSSDVVSPEEWYYPYVRYAIATSMTMVSQDGTLSPAKQLTRAEVAMLLYRFLMYKEGRRTQALLSESESEIINVLQQLDAKNIDQAEFASARSLIAARGALTSKPEEPLVKGALKIAEGFQVLVQAYKAGVSGELETVIRLAGDAWHLGEKAKSFSSDLSTLATQMQTIAKSMADEVRALQGQ